MPNATARDEGQLECNELSPQFVISLLKGRVTIAPGKPWKWEMRGEGRLDGLFERVLLQAVVRPHGDPVACIRCAGPLERLRHGTLVRTMPPNENDPGSVYGVEALCG